MLCRARAAAALPLTFGRRLEEDPGRRGEAALRLPAARDGDVRQEGLRITVGPLAPALRAERSTPLRRPSWQVGPRQSRPLCWGLARPAAGSSADKGAGRCWGRLRHGFLHGLGTLPFGRLRRFSLGARQTDGRPALPSHTRAQRPAALSDPSPRRRASVPPS